MFTDFTTLDRWTKKQVHCLYQALVVAIATRHADAVDIKFLVDGRPVWVALPHPAWIEYKKQTGKTITLHVKVDPNLLGGAVTRVGSVVWDGSVRHYLDRVRERLLSG